jgi:isocitrate/isopropylmalate dehydrogenase
MIRFAVLPGDGIGGEVLAGPLEILTRLAAQGRLEVSGPWPVGASAYLAGGEGLPAATLAACKAADAILFGAVGEHPGFAAADYRPEQSLLFLREYFDLRVSIRQVWRGEQAPLTIVRNLLGGAYGNAATRDESDGARPASDLVRLTPEQIAEVVEIGCAYAAQTDGRLVSVDKANLLATSRLWRRVATRVTAERGLACRHVYVDQCAFELARRGLPEAVLVTEGLFGDILSDLAAAKAGSIALCSSASVHPGPAAHGRCVGLFEPVHGTAPDIVGQGIANPTGAYLALAAALEWFPATAGLAGPLRQVLARALAHGPVTRDLAGPGGPVAATGEFAAHVNRVFLAGMAAR